MNCHNESCKNVVFFLTSCNRFTKKLMVIYDGCFGDCFDERIKDSVGQHKQKQRRVI